MFPTVAFVFFIWLLIVGARENGLLWASVFTLLGVVLLGVALQGWIEPFVLTIGVCILAIGMIVSIWGVDPWS